jgi:hypothetical protein
MTAEFYIVPESFRYKTGVKARELEEKIKNLADDCFSYIREYKDENRIFVHPDIYSVDIFDGITISDFLYNAQQICRIFDRDVIKALRKIITENSDTTYTVDFIVNSLLPNHDENVCYGLICFNEIEKIAPDYQIVYNLHNWFVFRRYFLGLYPKNADYYIDECKKYFKNLFFHENNKNTIKKIFSNCPKKILYHLAALNDCLPTILKEEKQLQVVLKNLTAAAHLDEAASLEGNVAHKEILTFKFKNTDGKIENVYCEAHLKICYNDNYPHDTSYSTDRRIYFHPGRNNIQNGKILIGHIGKHL